MIAEKWNILWGKKTLSYTEFATQDFEEYTKWIKSVKAEGEHFIDILEQQKTVIESNATKLEDIWKITNNVVKVHDTLPAKLKVLEYRTNGYALAHKLLEILGEPSIESDSLGRVEN